QISPKDKNGLSYNGQLNERDLNNTHMNKSKVFESASDSSVNESKEDNNQVNDRYKAGEGYHAVPPPYTGNFMPPRPDLSFSGLDDFVFKSTMKILGNLLLNNTHIGKLKTLGKTRILGVDKRNWNGIMTQKLGDDFEFKKKACFVWGSLNHLIKDCNFYENKMVGKSMLNNEGKATGQKEDRQSSMVGFVVVGEGSRQPIDPQHTSIYAQLSNEEPITVLSSPQLKKTHKPRKAKRTTKISQFSGPIHLVADETVYKEWEDRMERAATTASSLEPEEDNDGKVKLVSEASIRRHLTLEDSDGISTFSNTEIFKQLAIMGASKGYTGVDIPLFSTMLVQGLILQGERSTVPLESHHTPSGAPTTLQPLLSSPSRIPTRQETKVPQPSFPTHTHVADEVASTGVDVRHGRAATTISSLDVGQGSGERKPRKGQNQIKTGEKREAWRSREKFKAVAVGRARKTEQNAKRMAKNANAVKSYSNFKRKKKRKVPFLQLLQSSNTRTKSAKCGYLYTQGLVMQKEI
nr:hypothetical protein [Tanacetum cinerariifolium]